MDPLNHTLYDSAELLGIMQKTEADNPPSTFWLDRFFPGRMTFTTRYIEFGEIIENRTMAPLVMPLAPGRPTVKEAAERTRFAPAYVKPKDSVMAVEAFAPNPVAVLNGEKPSAKANWDYAVAKIMKKHLDVCALREEWMAAKTILDGKLVLESQDYPRAVVDFGRDPNLDIVLAAGTRWADAGVNIADQFENWRIVGRSAKFSGAFTAAILGREAWAAMRVNPSIKDLLDTRYRGSTTNLKTLEPGNGMEVESKGFLGDIEILTYSGWIEDEQGNHVDLMNPKDILFHGSSVGGVLAYGAIADKGAEFRALPRFTKMWDEEDPSQTNILTQSAPLTVPRRINNTMRVRVVA